MSLLSPESPDSPIGSIHLLGTSALHYHEKWKKRHYKAVPPPTPNSEFQFNDSLYNPLPDVFPELENVDIPIVREIGIKQTIRELGKILQCNDYEMNFCQFWFLDILTDCIWTLQDTYNFPEKQQKVVLKWLLFAFDLLRDPKKNLSREQFYSTFLETFYLAADFIDAGANEVPLPHDIAVQVGNNEEEVPENYHEECADDIPVDNNNDDESLIQFETENGVQEIYLTHDPPSYWDSDDISIDSNGSKEQEEMCAEIEEQSMNDSYFNVFDFYKPDSRTPSIYKSFSTDSKDKKNRPNTRQALKNYFETEKFKKCLLKCHSRCDCKIEYSDDDFIIPERRGDESYSLGIGDDKERMKKDLILDYIKYSHLNHYLRIANNFKKEFKIPAVEIQDFMHGAIKPDAVCISYKRKAICEKLIPGIHADPKDMPGIIKDLNEIFRKNRTVKEVMSNISKNKIADVDDELESIMSEESEEDVSVTNNDRNSAEEDIKAELFALLKARRFEKLESSVFLSYGVLWAILEVFVARFKQPFLYYVLKNTLRSVPTVIIQNLNDTWNTPKTLSVDLTAQVKDLKDKHKMVSPKKTDKKKKKDKKSDKSSKKSRKSDKSIKSDKSKKSVKSDKSKKSDKEKKGKKDKKVKKEKKSKADKEAMKEEKRKRKEEELRLKKLRAEEEAERIRMKMNKEHIFPLTDAVQDTFFQEKFPGWVKPKTANKKSGKKKGKKK